MLVCVFVCLLVCIAGIAYDSTRKRLFITGKYWPRIFEVVPQAVDPSNNKYSRLVSTCYIRE